MTINPYEAPQNCADDCTLVQNPANRTAQVGFALSLTGAMGVFLAGPLALFGTVGIIAARLCILAAFLSLPGLLISALGLFGSPRKHAISGLILGVVGSLLLPAFFFSFPMRSIVMDLRCSSHYRNPYPSGYSPAWPTGAPGLSTKRKSITTKVQNLLTCRGTKADNVRLMESFGPPRLLLS